jgi:hypothetical protein
VPSGDHFKPELLPASLMSGFSPFAMAGGSAPGTTA